MLIPNALIIYILGSKYVINNIKMCYSSAQYPLLLQDLKAKSDYKSTFFLIVEFC